MRFLKYVCLLIGLASCSDQDLNRENQELLEITKNLTSTVEELKRQVEHQQQMAMDAAAQARNAEANALEQVLSAKGELEKLKNRLANCK